MGFKNAPSHFKFLCIIEISFAVEVYVFCKSVSCVSLHSFLHCLYIFCKSPLLIGYYRSQSCFVINMMLSVLITAIPEGQDCSSYI